MFEFFRSSIDISWFISNKTRVFDCFMYNGESEMLYTHLWRMDPYVDIFVVYLTPKSFVGTSRTLTFAPFEKEINAFKHKMLIMDMDSGCSPKYRSSGPFWCREKSHRSALIWGINVFKPQVDDIILLSDVDEILTQKGIREIIKNPPKTFYTLRGLLFSPNFMFIQGEWNVASAIRYTPEINDLQYYREMGYKGINIFPSYPIVTHCTYCFNSYKKYFHKLQTFPHQEYNKYPYTNASFIFRMHYCRYSIKHEKKGIKQSIFDVRKLVPKHKLLEYLTNDTYILSINNTVYSNKDLKNLCSWRYKYKKKGIS